jgi:Ca-activated chloride channel family protein
VDQVFINNGDKDMEAVYSFPVPARASMSELSLWINGKEVIGEVVEKEKARKLYDDQKNQGNSTALAEKNDYKTFDISVYPVVAGKDTRVRLVYYQPVTIDLNVGRYVYPLAEGGVDEERISFWSTDDEVTGSFIFNCLLKSAFPLKDVRIPGFASEVQILKDTVERGEQWRITLHKAEGANLSKDIVCYYRLDDDAPARVELIPYRTEGSDEGVFMAVVTPGGSLKPIARGTDWTFVLDVSGSMSGGKIQTLCKGVEKTLKRLDPSDRYRIITFNENAREITRGFVRVTPESVADGISLVNNISADGSTNMYDGLHTGLRGIDADRTQGIILVTDGVTNTGLIEHCDFLTLLRKHDIRLFTFVIGNSANSPLLERMAEESNGFAMTVSESDDIIGRILQAQAKVCHQNMRNAKLEINGIKTMDMAPGVVPSLYLGQQYVTFGRYKGHGNVTLTFIATIEGQKREWTCKTEIPPAAGDHPEIERLYAYARIREIMKKIREEGEKDDYTKAVVNLGTEYSLVTDYTSMLVLSEEERETLGLPARNAERVAAERRAQERRALQAPRSYRADKSGGGMFQGVRVPNIGSGPVGPLFIVLTGLTGFFRKRRKNNGNRNNAEKRSLL